MAAMMMTFLETIRVEHGREADDRGGIVPVAIDMHTTTTDTEHLAMPTTAIASIMVEDSHAPQIRTSMRDSVR